MNEQERLELAERMAPLTDEERIEFLNALPTMPEAEELASIQSLISDFAANSEEAVASEVEVEEV